MFEVLLHRFGRCRAAGAGALLLAFIAGCGTESLRDLREEATVREILGRGEKAVPYICAVAPVRVESELRAVADISSRSDRPRLDPLTLQSRIREVLETASIFQSVETVAHQEEAGEDRVLGEARNLGADLLLSVRVRKCENSYRGTNGWYIPNFVLWFLVMIPSWWVADEVYAAELDVEVTVRSVHSGKVVYRRPFRSDVEMDLDDFDRGFMFFGILRVPGALEADNWEKIGELLNARVFRDFALKMLRDLDGPFRRETRSPAFAGKMRKKLGLVVGVSNHRHYMLPKIWFSSLDAEAFSAFLLEKDFVGMEERNLRVLLDQQAVGTKVRDALRKTLVELARPSDQVFLYFAGYGSMTRGREGPTLYLLPHDAVATDVAGSGISLSSLAFLLNRCRAKNVVIIVDAAFGPFTTGRAFYKGDPVEAEEIERELTRIGSMKGVFLLTGAAAGEECAEFEEGQKGLFTHHLLTAMRGAADEDRDGKVTLKEAYRFAAERVFERALLEGRTQNPRLYGKGAEDVVLTSVKGRGK
jgi:hypothetical protein